MKNRNTYKLLYNQLWLIDPKKAEHLKLNAPIGYNWEIVDPISIRNPKEEFLKSKATFSETGATVKQDEINISIVGNSPLSDKLITNAQTGKMAQDLILDWDMLVSQINNCAKCELCHTRQNVVIERGNRQAKWMFIGEGPGEQEDIQGKPFVGISGQLLQKMIGAMKLNPDTDVYICNMVKCRPPYNRNPEALEIEACKNYLFSQIELVNPEIIVTLGRFACQTLLNTNLATGRLRNQVHYYQKIPLIVTYHPSYLLRNPTAKKDAWADLQLAMQTFSGI